MGDRHLQKQRLPQVALQHLADPQHELGGERLVQPVLHAGGGNIGGSGLVAQQQGDRVTRRKAREQKHQHGDDGEHHQRAAQALE
ncbi:hypothetical protein D3C72_1873230 [compost metagenome]